MVTDCSSETLSPLYFIKELRKQEKIKERRWNDEMWVPVLAVLLIPCSEIRSAQSLTFLLWKMEGVAEIMLWVLPQTQDHRSPRPLASGWHDGTEFWPMDCGPLPRLDIKWSLPTCDPPPFPKVSKNLWKWRASHFTPGEAWMPKFTAWRRPANCKPPDQTLCEWEQILFLLSHWDFGMCYSN